jgi:ribosome-associated translation inhibitor RaiA
VSETPESQLARAVATRVEEIVAAAESATDELRRRIEAEVARYEREQRERIDAETEQLRLQARAEVERHLADARARIDAWANERLNAISALTDRLIEHANQLQQRFEAAEKVRSQVYELIGVIGDAAERLAQEAARPDPELPERNLMSAERDQG